MIKILFIFFLLPCLAHAQLQGIGIFKINKSTTSLIDSISIQSSVPIEKTEKDILMIVYQSLGSHLTNKIIEVKRDSNDYYGGTSESFLQKNVRVFYINYYKVVDIDIEDIFLTFYKDTLVQFKCKSSSDFVYALNIKYGKPEVKRTEKTILCQNGYGATTTHEEHTRYSSWNTKYKNISANEIDHLWYDTDDCKPMLIREFFLKDEFKKSKIDKIEHTIMTKIEIQKNKRASKNLKDF